MAEPVLRAMDAQNGSRRKRSLSRSTSSGSNSASSNTMDASIAAQESQTHVSTEPTSLQLPSPVQTPRRAKKRVRFSDPGLSMRDNGLSGTTGLTPALQRTSVGGYHQSLEPRTPSRRSNRRRSAPSTLPNTLIDPVLPGPINVQFTPLGQILDSRTRRRLWRSGLSDEMNKIEDDKKEMKKAKAQIDALSKELESYRSTQMNVHTFSNEFDTIPLDEDTMDDSILLSNSPIFDRHQEAQSPDDLESPVSISPQTPRADSAIQVSILDDQPMEEMQTLSDDLSAARKEKQDLFDAWRKLNAPQTPTDAQAESPPPDFMQQIVPTLESALRRASDANQALETVKNELTKMGFPGESVDDILSQMRECFRSARLELERVLPGQTPAGLFDVKATLEVLIKRFRQSCNALMNERKRADSLDDNHKAIKKQFDFTLEQLEKERERSRKMEETADASVEDMLHIRMRIQELETEVADKATIIERFNQALKQYHEEGKNFEAIIEKMEEENRDDNNVSTERIRSLESTIVDRTELAAGYLGAYKKLKKSVRRKDIELDELAARVEALGEENRELLDSLTKRHQEIGKLNSRYSQDVTDLQSAKSDLEKTRRLNELLEAHNEKESESRQRLETWFNKVVQDSHKVFRTERRDAEARQVEIEIETSHILSDDLPSEPSLPTNSPFRTPRDRSLENIRIGRGKDRRTLDSDIVGRDSGIGLSTDNNQSELNNAGSSDGFLEEVNTISSGDRNNQ